MDDDSDITGVLAASRVAVGNGKVDGGQQLGEVRSDKGHGLH